MIRRSLSDRPTRRFHGSWRASSFLGIAASLVLAGTALAGWGGFGTGTGSVGVSDLGTTTVTATPRGGGADLTWTLVSPPGGSAPVMYYVERDGSDAASTCPTAAAPAAVTSCSDSGIGAGTYSYAVVAVFHSWTAASAPVVVTVASGALDHFGVTAATNPMTAGAAGNVTIRAYDAGGILVTSYSGGHCLTFSGPGNSPNGTEPIYPPAGACSPGDSYVTFANGAATVPITLVAATSSTILHVHDVPGHSNGAGLSIEVVGGTASSFRIPTPGTQTAGVAFNISIAAKDAYGNDATSYDGTYCLVFSGPGSSPSGQAPAYPAHGSCAAGRSSVLFTRGSSATVPITLYNPVSTILTATDQTAGAAGSTGSFNVLPAGAASFVIANPGGQTAGTPFTVTITAMDGYGSVATGYAGAKCVTFSGPGNSPSGVAPVYPAAGGCSAGSSAVTFANGVGSAQITLFRAGATSLTATDGGVTGTSPSFPVSAAGINRFAMTAATADLVAGAPDNLTITALDGYGNTAAGYTGSHSLTFSGASAVPNSPFAPNVTNAAGAGVNFGGATSITFTAGVARVSGSSNGVMRLYKTTSTTPVTPISIIVSDGTYNNNAAPLSVTVRAVATSVAAGGAHTCAVLSYGGVECWGDNPYGQLGNGTTTASATPVAVRNITNAIAVGAGISHTCALLSDGTVRCWGANDNGELGNGTTVDSSVPVVVSGLSNVATLAVGGRHACVLLANGTVSCWGRNNVGQIGDGTFGNVRTTPVAVPGLSGVTSLGTGYDHNCALVANGSGRCWGYNADGELGDGTTTQRNSPVAVTGLSGATQISAGRDHSCARLDDGSLVCWGDNTYGQLGDGSRTERRTPRDVSNIGNATQVVAGQYHTCAVLADGTADCWGRNDDGQLGDGTTTRRTRPVQVSGLAGVTALALGGETDPLPTVGHSVALLGDGTVRGWGDNSLGQLGTGTAGGYSTTQVQAQLQ